MMSDSPDRITDEQLHLYLDGMLSAEEKSAFEKRLNNDPEAARVVKTQQELDAKLREAFSPPIVSTQQIEELIRNEREVGAASSEAKRSMRRRVPVLIAVGIAASILWVVVFWNSAPKTTSPFFEPRSLATIYREMVSQGFRPYYDCEDEVRFAMTFAKRQNVPLRLTKMPDDRRMLGLSYPGGLSRNTTAILCYVENQPVIAFVDVSAVDDPSLATSDAGPDLHVHRKELGDLVIYELSPLSQANIMDFLQLR